MTETAETALHRGHGARDGLVRAVAALPEAAPATLEDELYAALARDRRAVDSLRRALDALGWDRPATVRHLEWAPIARARLEAALVGVPDALLDAVPLPD